MNRVRLADLPLDTVRGARPVMRLDASTSLVELPDGRLLAVPNGDVLACLLRVLAAETASR